MSFVPPNPFDPENLIKYKHAIAAEEAAKEARKTRELLERQANAGGTGKTVKTPCRYCNGTGLVNEGKCGHCQGGGTFSNGATCPQCKGTGRDPYRTKCNVCRGNG